MSVKKLVIEIHEDGTVTWGKETSIGITIYDMNVAADFLDNEADCALSTV